MKRSGRGVWGWGFAPPSTPSPLGNRSLTLALFPVKASVQLSHFASRDPSSFFDTSKTHYYLSAQLSSDQTLQGLYYHRFYPSLALQNTIIAYAPSRSLYVSFFVTIIIIIIFIHTFFIFFLFFIPYSFISLFFILYSFFSLLFLFPLFFY